MPSTVRRAQGQPFGARAKQAASALAFGQTVTIQVRDRDRYGRTVADVILPDGRQLNRELVRTGYAWWFRRYSADARLADAEAAARSAQAGLWHDRAPVPPWEWRSAGRRTGVSGDTGPPATRDAGRRP
jgi:endonuclease YncB( thermonuclease family)